jgi:predicted enzyme related to lactoylglutathione lyase
VPQRADAPIGAPVWIELFTSDADTSRAFYRSLFGWTSEDPNPELGNYFNSSKDGVLVAGGMINDGSSGQPDGWTVYLASDDAKRTVDDAAAGGASVIVPASDVMDLGRFGVLVDPGGAPVGVWEPGTHRGFGVYDEPGTAGWFELHTQAYDKAVEFYRNAYRWDAHTMSDTPEFRYTTYGEGESALAGIMDASAMEPGVPSYWAVYFRVADTDAVVDQIEKLGGAVVTPGHDTPYGRLAVATDPTGAQFRLVG